MENSADQGSAWVPGPRGRVENEPWGLEDVVSNDGPHWHPMRWLSLVLLVALGVGSAGGYVEHRMYVHEAARVAACQHSLRLASALSERRMGLLADYVQPARPASTGVQQLHLADLMAERAAEVLPRAQRADRICRAVTVRPWYFSLVARRDAARSYSGALVTLLETVAAQGRRPFPDSSTLVLLRAGAGAN